MYITSFGFKHTGADAADSTMFAMRNPPGSGKKLKIRRLILQISSDETTATEAQAGYKFARFSGANPTGGSSPVRVNTNSRAGASCVEDANIKYGAVLTTTNFVFETGLIALFEGANNNGALQSWNLGFEDIVGPAGPECVVLYPGEGICMRVSVAASVRLNHTCSIWWDEVQN